MKMSEEKKEEKTEKKWNILYANDDILIAVPQKDEEE